MSLYLDDGDVKIYHGDALEQLAAMPAESVQCIVTSPPFWALRSYIADDHVDKPKEHGLESTPTEWVERLVAVFRECRRVLRNDGCCWAPSCGCRILDTDLSPSVEPCVVLDPFMGSGTTALVARRLGRHAVGIELNEEYLAIAGKRLQQLSLLGGAS